MCASPHWKATSLSRSSGKTPAPCCSSWALTSLAGSKIAAWKVQAFGSVIRPSIEKMCAWIAESYRVVAPKTLARQLD